MFRKTAFVLATTAALGAAALAPTAASARPFGHHGWGLGIGIGAGLVGAAIVANSCVHRETFYTPYGWRTRWVNVCY
jgi:hypothetical protein